MSDTGITRRHALGVMGAAAAGLIVGCGSTDEGGGGGDGDDARVKVGLLIPLSGVYASLGKDMRAGWELWLSEHGGKFGDREVQTTVADEGETPDTAIPALQKLLQEDRVDVVTGIVSSAVALGAQDIVNRAKKVLIVSNAGANDVTGPQASRYIWRTSFNNSQVSFAMGQALVESEDPPQRVYTLAPDYAAGDESVAGFVAAYEKGDGRIVGGQKTPFGTTEDYQPYLARLRRSGAEATYVFYAGGEAVAFVKQYDQFGLKDDIRLVGAGFLTEGGVLKAQGRSAEGVQTALHYADTLDNPQNRSFVEAYTAKTGGPPTTYAMQQWDAAEVLNLAIRDAEDLSGDALVTALEGIGTIENSPRGPWSFDNRTPKQPMYLREVVNGRNEVRKEIGVFGRIEPNP